MEIPHELAGGYMFYLAKTIAANRSLDLITDSSDSWTAGTYFANNGRFTEQIYAEKANSYLANLAVDDLLPANIDQVPMDKILHFLEKHREERALFQKELASLRDEISKCNNKSHAKYIAEDFVKTFQYAKAQYKDSLRFFRISDGSSLFSVGIPISMGFLALPMPNAGDPYAPLRLGAGLVLGAVSYLAAQRFAPRGKNVASYLVSAEYLTRTPSNVLTRKFNEFIND